MNRKHTFTLVEIMIVVAIIGLLAAIAVPGFMKARATTLKNTCIEGLRVVDHAVQQWAMENGKSDGDAVDAGVIATYMKDGATMPTCKGVAIAQPANVGDAPVCPNDIADHVLP